MIDQVTVPTDPTGSEAAMISERTERGGAENQQSNLKVTEENKANDHLLVITDQAYNLPPNTQFRFYDKQLSVDSEISVALPNLSNNTIEAPKTVPKETYLQRKLSE